MDYDELYKAAMEAYKDPETRLSSNLKMHRDRYIMRHRAKGRKAETSAEVSNESVETD